MDIVGESDGSSSDDDEGGRPAAPRRRGYRDAGDSCTLLILATTAGFWNAECQKRPNDIPASGHPALAGLQAEGGAPALVGAVVGTWRLKDFLDQREAEHDWIVSRAYAMFARSYIDVYGHVEYTPFAAVALQEVAPVTSDSRVPSVLLVDARHRLLASGTSLGTWLAAQPSTVSIIALSPPLALSIVHGYWQTFHAVAITNRTNFKRFPLRVLPSSKVLRRFANSGAPGRVAPSYGFAGVHESRWAQQVPAHLVLQWLKAAKFLKFEKKTPECAEAFADIFTGDCDQQVMVLKKSESINLELVRKARTRLDAVAMLTWRAMFAELDLSRVLFHLWVDGSPQFRGREMFAMTVDIGIPGEMYERRLLPCVSLRSSQMDHYPKPSRFFGRASSFSHRRTYL